jgi:hypothetical protein
MESASGARGAGRTAVGWLDRVAGTAWFAYGSVFLIQTRVLWGIWEHRDLTSGDTARYFSEASRWTHGFHLDPLWSPLYAFFWGSLRWIFDDPYTTTILHRVLIVLAATLLVLAVLRRLLSPGIAWVLAVWWAILPINYDVLYEVHLFALLPELAAVLIALAWSGLRMRGTVFAVLLASTILVRNEHVVALGVWTVAWIAYEVRARRRGEGTEMRRLLAAAGLPVLAIGAVTGALILSWPNSDLRARFETHESVSVCQAYALGYQQRHQDFKGNPFTGCERLMERDFGQYEPSMTEAIRANAGAMGAHFLWNARLFPYGMQLMLFDRISAGGQDRDPDYIPVRAGSSLALLGSVLLMGFALGGLTLLWHNRRRWWQSWIGPRAWGWLALGALAATAVVAALWQRPRPEYLFGLSVGLLAVIGTCAMAYADRWPTLKRGRPAIPLAALLLLILIPAHYGSGYVTPQIGPGRPLKEMVDRLYPMRRDLRGSDVKLLATSSGDACAYVGGDDPCKPIRWKSILSRDPGVSVADVLETHGVDFIYVDRVDLENPAIRDAIHQAEAAGWARIAPSSAGQGWLLIKRPTSPNKGQYAISL